jgi:lipopolysaccharide/colanic/teichoic acid biosynthesis glycosyltransferase
MTGYEQGGRRAGGPATAQVPAWSGSSRQRPDGHSPEWIRRRFLLVAWDALGWAVALVAAAGLRQDFNFAAVTRTSFVFIIAVAVLAQLVFGAALATYRGRYPVGGVDEAVNVAATTALAGSTVFVIDFLPQPIPRSVPLLAVPIAVLIAVGSRLAVRLYREHRHLADYSRARRVIVLGAGTEGQVLLRSMLADPGGRYLPVAFLDDDQKLRRLRVSGVEVCGTRADVALTAAQARADMLVIADRSLGADTVQEVAVAAREVGLTVRLMPTLDELLLPLPAPAAGAVPRPSAGDGALGAVTRPLPRQTVLAPSPAASRAKRALDIGVCVVLVLLVLPLLLFIALLLEVTARQVIYRAPRIGRDGKQFTMFKFVTMTHQDNGPRVTARGDLRITRIGRWLRATKLNELPQIFNVIKGDMSLVGPRPEDPRYAARYARNHRQVLTARPGMTSLAFLRFGDEEEYIARAAPPDVEAFYLETVLPKKLDIELDYVRTWSLRKDLRILASTARMLL